MQTRPDQSQPGSSRPAASTLAIYIPREGTPARAAVAEQAGVVGTTLESGRVLLDYEANLHDAANIRTFADKIHHAAGRHREMYPTRARTEVDAAAVAEVGTYDGTVRLDPSRREVVARLLEISEEELDEQCRRTE